MDGKWVAGEGEMHYHLSPVLLPIAALAMGEVPYREAAIVEGAGFRPHC